HVRGLLLCTGEDVPDHSASATARIIKIQYPRCDKDLKRGRRCREQRQHYSAVTADFLRWLLAEQRKPAFCGRVDELRQRYYELVQGRDNDVRIAGNFAMLAAAFDEFATYLGDVWESASNERANFIDN